MAYGDPINVLYFTFLQILFPIFMLVYVVFSSIPLSRYMQTKQKVSIYYAMTNIIFTSLFVVMEIGIMDALTFGSKTDIYYFSILYMNIGIIAASIYYYLFLAEITTVDKTKRLVVIIAGMAVISFQILIWPLWFPTAEPDGMQLTSVTQIFQTVFCVAVYISMAREFLNLAKHTDEKKKELKVLGIASLLMFTFFIFMLLRVAFMNIEILGLIVQISSWGILMASTVGFFYGFIYPNLRKGKEKKKE